MQMSWDSAKSFLVAKSIIWSAEAAVTVAFTQHPTPAVLATGTLVSHWVVEAVMSLWDSSGDDRTCGPGCLDSRPDFPPIQ